MRVGDDEEDYGMGAIGNYTIYKFKILNTNNIY